jgi:DNA invertase Pin-like site-specific DNA recombinase
LLAAYPAKYLFERQRYKSDLARRLAEVRWGRIIPSPSAALAEKERALISERTRVALAAAKERNRPTRTKPLQAKLVFTILSAVAENERDRIRERVRDAKRHRAEQRLYNGGKRQFGWDVVDGRLVSNATEQAVVERMKSMRANGATYREIGGEVGMYGRTVQRVLDRA